MTGRSRPCRIAVVADVTAVVHVQSMFSRVAIVEAGRIVRNDDAEIIVPWWSFTKTLIAAAALALARDGALRLDDRLPGRSYSLRLLLQHRAGLADYGGLKRYHDAVSARSNRLAISGAVAEADAEPLRVSAWRGLGLFQHRLSLRHASTWRRCAAKTWMRCCGGWFSIRWRLPGPALPSRSNLDSVTLEASAPTTHNRSLTVLRRRAAPRCGTSAAPALTTDFSTRGSFG